MAWPASCHDLTRKPIDGQFPAPEPKGKVWLASGIYLGRFDAVRLVRGGAPRT